MADIQLGLYHHPPQMMTMDAIEARARGLGVNLSSVDLNSITLPDDEDFDVHSDDEEELVKDDPPELEMGFGNTVVVDNVPVIPPEKFEKLEKVIRKVLNPAGVIKECGFWIPFNADTNKTYGYFFFFFRLAPPWHDLQEARCGTGARTPAGTDAPLRRYHWATSPSAYGYCFIEFNTPQEAEAAREIGNGYRLDKNHILLVNTFDDFERYMKVRDGDVMVMVDDETARLSGSERDRHIREAWLSQHRLLAGQAVSAAMAASARAPAAASATTAGMHQQWASADTRFGCPACRRGPPSLVTAPRPHLCLCWDCGYIFRDDPAVACPVCAAVRAWGIRT